MITYSEMISSLNGAIADGMYPLIEEALSPIAMQFYGFNNTAENVYSDQDPNGITGFVRSQIVIDLNSLYGGGIARRVMGRIQTEVGDPAGSGLAAHRIFELAEDYWVEQCIDHIHFKNGQSPIVTDGRVGTIAFFSNVFEAYYVTSRTRILYSDNTRRPIRDDQTGYVVMSD
jgi:hypothetical protein